MMLRSGIAMVTAAFVAAAAALPLAVAFAPPSPPRPATALASYLDTLSRRTAVASSYPPPFLPGGASSPPPAPDASSPAGPSPGPCRAPLEYFALDELSSKGPRAAFDWGSPQDWSRKLSDDGVFRSGAWYCTEGGWESPNGKAVTEVFYVLEGHGALGDADGAKHFFGPGDVVIIPKGHTGRWDVNVPIHKVWAVNAHEAVEETGPVIRVRVDHHKDFVTGLEGTGDDDPLYGNTGGVPSASRAFYDVGPTMVGVWTCGTGSFEVTYGERQWSHLLEGIMFVTDGSDGTSRRCAAGDTVVLPRGWYGHVDVVEPVKKIFTVAR